jgi:hypothetical protein
VLRELVTTLLVLSGGRCERYKCLAGIGSQCNCIIVTYLVRIKFGG